MVLLQIISISALVISSAFCAPGAVRPNDEIQQQGSQHTFRVGNLVNLDPIGGGNLVNWLKSSDTLDPIGGGNLINLDPIGGGNLVSALRIFFQLLEASNDDKPKPLSSGTLDPTEKSDFPNVLNPFWNERALRILDLDYLLEAKNHPNGQSLKLPNDD